MSLEEALVAATAAVTELTKALSGAAAAAQASPAPAKAAAPAPAKAAPAPTKAAKATAPAGPTRGEMNALLSKINETEGLGLEKAREVFRGACGAPDSKMKMAEIPDDKIAAVVEAAKAALAEAAGEDEGGGEGL